MGEDLARGHTAVARQGSHAAFCLVTPQVNGPWVRELSEGLFLAGPPRVAEMAAGPPALYVPLARSRG